MKEELTRYNSLLKDIKIRVRKGQLRANLSANAEMLAAYWDIGKMIHQLQQSEGWGKAIIPRLARDLKNEIPEVKGFSERNILRMLTFYKEYSDLSISPLVVAKLDSNNDLIGQPTVAHLDSKLKVNPPKASSNLNENEISPRVVAKLNSDEDLIDQSQDEQSKNAAESSFQTNYVKTQSDQMSVERTYTLEYKKEIILLTGWAHHTILIEKIKDPPTRYWYMQQCLSNGWSRDTLIDMIKSNLHLRQGKAANNFELTLPPIQSSLAKQMLKDPYIFDFVTLATEYSERELELELVKNVEKFLLEMGAGFAFVGRQYKLEISDKEVYLDLLFYHLKMRCFVVIDLKRGEFIPEYAGKMNFYCSAVDDILRHPSDQQTIGLILCKSKDKLFAEYALRDLHKPIGISDYELTRILPETLKSSLPSVEEIETELFQKLEGSNNFQTEN